MNRYNALNLVCVIVILFFWHRKMYLLDELLCLRTCAITKSFCTRTAHVRKQYDIVLRWASAAVAQKEYGELRYALRSLHNNHDVRRVHVVYAGTLPDWLNVAEVQCVPEDTIIHSGLQRIGTTIDKCVRSSELCKIGFDLIPDLHERFVAMDDDFILLHAKVPFYNENGIPLMPTNVWMTHRPLPFIKLHYRREAALIPKHFYEHKHIDRLMYDIFPRMCYKMKNDVIQAPWSTDSNPAWRSPTCMTYWCNNITIHQNGFERFLNYVLRFRPCFVCINDDWSRHKDADNYYLKLQTFYHLLLPARSRYEIDPSNSG